MTLKEHKKELVALCRRYGTPKYVNGGGGNISWKNENTLWIKASGTYLSQAGKDTLVAVKREPLQDLYRLPAPENSNQREAWAIQIIQSAVAESESGKRPSVETPLHDLLSAAFVVHTHPPLVNGMTCARDAESACRTLFPEAMWMPYVDPGVTLSLQAKQQIDEYVGIHGREPSIIFMQNHGLVVTADELSEIDRIHQQVFEVLKNSYRRAGVDTSRPVFQFEQATRHSPGLIDQDVQAAVILECNGISPAPGPLTPDHIVYSGVEPLQLIDEESVRRYREKIGTEPQLIIDEGSLYALGSTYSQAVVACELAADGEHVLRLTDAFGGVNYMTEEQWRFVVGWEAESYRQAVARNSQH